MRQQYNGATQRAGWTFDIATGAEHVQSRNNPDYVYAVVSH